MGLDLLIQAVMLRRAGIVVGICGGYQILCEEIVDEAGTDTGIQNRKDKGMGYIPG